MLDKCPNHVQVVCRLGSAASLHLTLPPTTMDGWVARKYFPYAFQLEAVPCMELEFGHVSLLLGNTSVPPAEQRAS